MDINMEREGFTGRLKAGDESAYAELLDEFQSRVLATCFKFFLSQEDAEDMAQEVFFEVFRSVSGFRGETSLSTWIYRIAVTRCMDELRRRNRKKRFGVLASALGLEDIARQMAGGSRPDLQLENKEMMSRIMDALQRLPDNQRIACTLSQVEGYTHAEIAEIMNTSVMAVESLIKRGRKKLQEQLS